MKPLNHNPRRIAKADKAFKDIKLPVKIRNIHNIGVSVFGNKDKKKDLSTSQKNAFKMLIYH